MYVFFNEVVLQRQNNTTERWCEYEPTNNMWIILLSALT